MVVATNCSVSSRQKFKFSSLSVAFSGLLVTHPCLTFCLSFTINCQYRQIHFHKNIFIVHKQRKIILHR